MGKGISMLAIPVFRSRVAPVLDWCSKILIFPEDAAEAISGEEIVLPNRNTFDRLRILQQEGVVTIICGALSVDLLSYGESLGLRIIHGIAGDIGEVLQAYRTRQLDQSSFWLPGYKVACSYRKR